MCNSDSTVCEVVVLVAVVVVVVVAAAAFAVMMSPSALRRKQRCVTGYSWPTAQHTVRHEKLTVSQPVKKFSDLCNTKHSLQPATGFYPTSHNFGTHIYFNSTVLVNSGPASHLFLWNISTKTLLVFLVCPRRVKCSAHRICNRIDVWFCNTERQQWQTAGMILKWIYEGPGVRYWVFREVTARSIGQHNYRRYFVKWRPAVLASKTTASSL